MFSYTDDAIVTSSPTGRHLSSVIRHPAGMPDDQWRKHADQVCQVLNELDSKAKASSLSLHFQTVGRVKRIDKLREQYAETIKRGFAQTAEGPSLAELIDSGYLAALERPFGPTWPFEDQIPLATEARQPMPSADPQREENVFLRGEVERLKRVLAAEQMPVELPIETAALRVLLENVGTGSLLDCKAPCGRTVIIKRVE